MIKAVVFDFGGVLLRTEDQGGRERWEARLGLPPRGLSKLVFDSDAARRATAGDAGVDAVWGHVATTLQLEPAVLAELQKDFWSGDRLDAALVTLIKSLRPRYKTAILSNAWPDGRGLFTQLFGASDTFDLFIISPRPHPSPAARMPPPKARPLSPPRCQARSRPCGSPRVTLWKLASCCWCLRR